MNSREVLEYLERLVSEGRLTRTSKDDRLSKGVRYETKEGSQLQLDLGNDLAFFQGEVLRLRGDGQRRATLTLEGDRINTNEAALIEGLEYRADH